MSKQHKYLVTTDADTGEVLRVERLGSAGELVEVPPETLGAMKLAAPPKPSGEAADSGEHAPGVFLGAELPEHAPGVFINAELPEHAPGIFVNAELPETSTSYSRT